MDNGVEKRVSIFTWVLIELAKEPLIFKAGSVVCLDGCQERRFIPFIALRDDIRIC